MILQTNHLPRVRSQDDGTWRRLRLVVPFRAQFAIPGSKHVMRDALPADAHLEKRLAAEAPGILRWIIDGAQAWYEQGLDPPQQVIDAALDYRQAEDRLASFLQEWTQPRNGAQAPAQQMYDAFRAHCALHDDLELSQPDFKAEMGRRGYRSKHTRDGNVYLGLELVKDVKARGSDQAEEREQRG